jgi:hypothetical protein
MSRRTFHILILSFAFPFCCIGVSWAQCAEMHDSHRLYAALHAQPGFYGDYSLETVDFVLINDSDQVLESSPGSWILVIDGKAAPDPGGQLWAGGKPAGGYRTVKPCQTFRFGKGLRVSEYFPEAHDYRVYWKAATFQSDVIVVRGGLVQR